MPTYQYACTACDERLEVVQKFTDDALTECPACGGRLRKVFSAVGIVFKGSGFYRTDSRESAKSKSAAASTPNGSGDKTEATGTKAAETTGSSGGGSDSSGSSSSTAGASAGSTASSSSASSGPSSSASSSSSSPSSEKVA